MAVCHSTSTHAASLREFTIPDCDSLVEAYPDASFGLLDDLGTHDRSEVPVYLGGLGVLGARGGGDVGATPRALDQEGPLSNTPLTTRQVAEASHAAGGLDWLEWCSYGRWDAKRFIDLRALLDSAKEEAQKIGRDVVIELCGEPVRVLSSGVRRGMYCRWCIEWQGIEVALVDRMEESPQAFSVHLIARSLACMDLGVGVYSRVCRFLERLGYRQSRTIVSRVDLAVDLCGVEVSQFVAAFIGGFVVRRARHFVVYGDANAVTGLTIGKSEVMLRVYDKFFEAMKSGDALKREVLIERRWNGNRNPQSATRVEFQLKRDALRVLKFQEVSKLLGNLKGVVRWLTDDWCRFTDGVSSRSHTERCPSSALWCGVRDVLIEAFRSGEERPMEWRRKMQGDPSRLLKQAKGCLSSAFALLGRVPGDLQDAAQILCDVMMPGLLDLYTGTHRKRALLETKAAVDRQASLDQGIGRVFGGTPVFT